MTSFFKTLPYFVVLFLLQSCAIFKPSTYDNQTKRYNNYKKNYSIEIVDGYSLVSSDTKDKLRKVYFQHAPSDIIIFFNKKSEATLGMWAGGNFLVSSREKKKEILESIEKGMNKACESTAGCHDMDVLITENGVSAELATVTDSARGRGIVTGTLFPLSRNSAEHGLYMLLGFSKLKTFEEFKEDYIKMSNSLLLPAFSEIERKPN